jgi:aspartyl-tRNA(Asn)/glutamyl-tRNA(Gln) amidotransferase subunit A
VARSAKDAALVLRTIAGSDPRDATGANLPVPDYLDLMEKEIKGLRIGLSPDYFQITFPNPETGEYQQQPVPKDIRDAVIHAAEIYQSMGVEIIENVPMPKTRFGIPVYFVISRVEAASNLHRFDGVKYGHRTASKTTDLKTMYAKSRGEGFGLQPKLRMLMGMYVSAAQYSEQYYKRALRARTLIRKDFEKVFDKNGKYKLDALLTPTTPTTAFPMKKVYGDSVLMQYSDQLAVPANHAGIPGISFPGGLDENGLPIGVQLLGPDFSESVLLQLTHAYEKSTVDVDWRKISPAVLREAYNGRI